MGACGCGEFQGGQRFPGPKGCVYVLAYYEACSECDCPAGFVIHKFTGEDIEAFDVMNDPKAKFQDGEFAIPVMSPQKVRDAIVKAGFGAATLPPYDGETMTLAELFDCDPAEWDEAITEGLRASMAGDTTQEDE